MKRFLRCLGLLAMAAIMLVTVGCNELTMLKPDMDVQEALPIIMRAVDKCPVTEDGWKILEIKAKDYAATGVKFVAFSHPVNGWGIGLMSDQECFAVQLIFIPELKQWFFVSWMEQPLTDEQAIEVQREWFQMFMEKGDLKTAQPYKSTPWVVEAPKTEL